MIRWGECYSYLIKIIQIKSTDRYNVINVEIALNSQDIGMRAEMGNDGGVIDSVFFRNHGLAGLSIFCKCLRDKASQPDPNSHLSIILPLDFHVAIKIFVYHRAIVIESDPASFKHSSFVLLIIFCVFGSYPFGICSIMSFMPLIPLLPIFYSILFFYLIISLEIGFTILLSINCGAFHTCIMTAFISQTFPRAPIIMPPGTQGP